MKRREFITLLGGVAAAWPLAVRAQQATPKTARIGWLKIQGPRDTPDQLQEFREGMRALGLVEGRDCELEERYADGHESQLPTLTAELLSTGQHHRCHQPAFDYCSRARDEKRAYACSTHTNMSRLAA